MMAAPDAVDRKQLRKIVFQSEKSRKQLEHILHRPAFQEMQRRYDELSAAYCILCIPLLVETETIGWVDRVLALDCRRALQVERAARRDGVSPQEIEGIIHAQAEPRRRLAVANDVLDNNGDTTHLEQQVRQLHQHYLELSQRAD